MPTAPSEDVVLTWFDQLSNWNRWGDDDRLGTLNHVTPAKRVAAAGLVRDGRVGVVQLGHPHRPPARRHGREPALHALDRARAGRRGPPDLLGGGRAGGAQEFIGMVFHGLDVTHLDSLAHIFWDGKMYGGAPASLVSDRQGALDARRAGRRRRASPPAACCSTSPGCAASTCSPPTTTSTPRTSRRPSRPPASASSPATWC